MLLANVLGVLFIIAFFCFIFFLLFVWFLRSGKERLCDTLDDRILAVLHKNSIAPLDLALELHVDCKDVLVALARLERRAVVQRCFEPWQDPDDRMSICWSRVTEWHKETLEQ